jgi:hypothetical protein
MICQARFELGSSGKKTSKADSLNSELGRSVFDHLVTDKEQQR